LKERNKGPASKSEKTLPKRTRVSAPPPTEQLIEYLAEIDIRVGELALALREIVLIEAPAATEVVFKSYVVATNYSFTGKWTDAFCYIAVYPRHVNLGFTRGAELEDPEGLLIGKGKIFRHLKIAQADDLAKPHVRAFIRAAIKHSRAELAERPPKPVSRSAAKTAARKSRQH
jgi:hypothetical protein